MARILCTLLLPSERTSGFFHFVTITNNADMNICLQVRVNVLFPVIWVNAQEGLVGLNDKCAFNFLRNC